jgi:arylsulfatase A-like enzyme
MTGEEPDYAEPVFSEFNLGSFRIRPEDRLVMVREGEWKLSLAFTPDPADGALYNLSSDPYERQNLWNDPESKEAQQRLVHCTN